MGQQQGRAALELRLLGPPQITRDGAPVKFDTRKAVALLAYLAVSGQAHARESLAALFWPEYSQERAYANLRRTLWALNSGLGKDWLEADQEAISLRPEPGLWLDVEAFQAHIAACRAHEHTGSVACPACQRHLSAAADLYQDDFMAGFTLRDSPGFDEWQFFQGDALRQELAWALDDLVACYAAQGELDLAIDCARRWLALDPIQEAAHRSLMKLYAWHGQRAAALRQYEECGRVLREELGVDPEEKTTALYELIRAGELPPLAGDETPPVPAVPSQASPARVPNNLPAQPTAFVGRTGELAEIAGLLRRPDCHLLTLAGPGGIGKTRLALEAAANELDADPGTYAHGIYAVSLAALESAATLVPAIADATGFPFFHQGTEDPKEQLLNYLCEKRMLLLLDNFEHLMEGAGLVADLLEHAAGVKVLVTSRERLNLRGEWVLEVGGMRFPEEPAVPAESLEAYSAVQLFLQRARQVDAGFSPSPGDLAALVRICQLVEGMPLGIELAAAWSRVFSWREIADQISGEIERSLDFLTTPMRDVPERHRNLRAVFDHSWRLLADAERDALRKLSVFRGGFQLEAAGQVTGASLAVLSALVDKSLLRRLPSDRYGFHELLRQYAAEKLDEAPPEQAAVRDRHASYFAGFMERREGRLRGAGQMQALEEIGREIENVQRAWRWAAGQGRVAEIGRAAGSLYRFYDMRSRFQAGEEAFGQAVAGLQAARPGSDAEGTPDPELGLVMTIQGYFASRLYDDQKAAELLWQGVALLRQAGARRQLALANILAGWGSGASLFYAEETEGADELEAMARESLAIYEELGDKSGIANALWNLGLAAALSQGDHAQAARLISRSAALNREIGNRWGAGFALFELGAIAQHMGARTEARRYYEESLEVRRQINDRWGMALCLDFAGYLARELGEFEEALDLHQESLALHREIGDRLGIAGSLDNLGLVYLDQDAYDRARACFEEALAIRRDMGRHWDLGISLQHLGEVALALEDWEEAARWYGESAAVYNGLDSAGRAMAHRGLGDVYRATEDRQQAMVEYRVALELALRLKQKPHMLDSLAGIAQLLADAGDTAESARLAALVAQHQASTLKTRQKAEAILAELSAQLDPKAMAALRRQAEGEELEVVAGQVLAAH